MPCNDTDDPAFAAAVGAELAMLAIATASSESTAINRITVRVDISFSSSLRRRPPSPLQDWHSSRTPREFLSRRDATGPRGCCPGQNPTPERSLVETQVRRWLRDLMTDRPG